MDMYLVYEKNYAIDDVDCIEECEMKLYSSLETVKEKSHMKGKYYILFCLRKVLKSVCFSQ